jgi:small-conductance mechanosensitive channel
LDQVFGDQFSGRLGDAERGFETLANTVFEPWTFVQFVVVLICLLVAVFAGKRLEAALELRVRAVRGNPRLLRFLALILRRTQWITAAILLGIALLVVETAAPRAPDAVIRIAFALIATWVAISIVARLIRNRALARFVAGVAWIVVALRVTGTFDAVAQSLDALAVQVGTVRISLWFTLQAIALTAILLWAAVVLGQIAERWIARSTDLTPSLRVLLGKLVQIALLVLAGAIALAVLGIDFTALAFFGGALGLGIGFGLQKVVSNFVSGIIILLDKSIKPGDTIAIGETFGWVRSLRARFVSVITRDGREYLIPNEDFVTQRVENWSFTDTLVRIDVTFGVSYNSDPHVVRKLAVEAIRGVERVQTSPPPLCHLTGFGESSLDFILRFWIADPQAGVTNVRGAALLACWDAFKAAGIEIPYPHREVIMKRPVEMPS